MAEEEEWMSRKINVFEFGPFIYFS